MLRLTHIPNWRVLAGILILCVGAFLCALNIYISATYDKASGTVLDGVAFGLLICMLPAVLLASILMWSGMRAHRNDYSRLLSVVQSHGAIDLDALSAELNIPTAQVKAQLYRAVQDSAFTGYINWNEKRLYSRESALLNERECPNCGGRLNIVGKGVVNCAFCGAEIFFSAPAT